MPMWLHGLTNLTLILFGFVAGSMAWCSAMGGDGGHVWFLGGLIGAAVGFGIAQLVRDSASGIRWPVASFLCPNCGTGLHDRPSECAQCRAKFEWSNEGRVCTYYPPRPIQAAVV